MATADQAAITTRPAKLRISQRAFMSASAVLWPLSGRGRGGRMQGVALFPQTGRLPRVMRTLILLRHAKAVRAPEADSGETRGLTGRGRRKAAAAGLAMQEAGLKPALALVSTSERTRQTAELGLANFALETRFEDALYHAAPESIWDAFAASDAES